MLTPHTRFEFGRDLLGPVFTDYLSKLDQTIKYFEREKDAKVLFVSRAGVRIRRLYEIYLKASDRAAPRNADYLWTSRFLTLKGTWAGSPEAGCRIIAAEFGDAPIAQAVSALLRGTDFLDSIDLDAPEFKTSSRHFREFIWGPSDAAHLCRWHLNDQSKYFSEYIHNLVGTRQAALLVDSGWQGTAQTLLSDWRTDVDWWGAYFGRCRINTPDQRYWNKMIGLVFEADRIQAGSPETCIIANRHLIEDVLEPRSSSVEHLQSKDGVIFAPAASAILDAPLTIERDALYLGLEAYVANLSPAEARAATYKKARAIWPEIAKAMLFPTPQQVDELARSTRSADFGRSLVVPLVLPVSERHAGDNAEARIADSLWPAAQVRLEYIEELVPLRQAQLAGLDVRAADDAGFFAPEQPKHTSVHHDLPTVAVITRTKDRNIFLRRAIESVSNQTFQNYLHVIVCDGGNIDEAHRTVDRSVADKRRTVLIDNVRNRGMEAASNIGIGQSRSDFIVIHDDDDTWHPEFLARSMEFLAGPRGGFYEGVATNSWYVSEEVGAAGLVIRDRQPYGHFQNIRIIDMAATNLFPPIAFLFRRSAYEKVGGFDEGLPVLGDWDFNLRVLAIGNIAAIPDVLANYHHRDVNSVGLFSNSVIGGRNKHVEFDAVVRNAFLRTAAEDGPGSSIGLLVNLNFAIQNVRDDVNRKRAGAGSSENTGFTQKLADDRWVALAHMVEREAEAVSARQLQESLAEALARVEVLERLADDRWIALAYLLGGPEGKVRAEGPPSRRINVGPWRRDR